MIAKANLGKGFGEVSGYVLETKNLPIELHPKVIETNNLVHSSANKIAEEMKAVASFNDRAKKPVMHMQISFHPDEKLTEEQAKKAIDSILKEVGISKDNHQYFIAEHFEKPHQHFHVVCNRVDLDGKLLNDSHLRIKLNVACDKVEKEQGLRPTEGRQYQFDTITKKGKFVKVVKEPSKKLPKNNNPKIQDAKQQVNDKIVDVLHTAKSAEEFKEKLAEKGVEVRFSEDRANNNAIRGASFRFDEVALKGGDIGYKWDEIKTILETNLALDNKIVPGQKVDTEAKKNWYNKYFEPTKGETIKTIALQKDAIASTFNLALEMKASAPERTSNIEIADQAIRTTMRKYNPNDNPWETWENLGGKQLYEELYKSVKETKIDEKTISSPLNEQINKIKSHIFKLPKEEETENRQIKKGFRL